VPLTVPQEFMDDITKFQHVIQFSFENAMREIFINTVEQAKEQLRLALKEVEESSGKTIKNEELDFSLSDLRSAPHINLNGLNINESDYIALNETHELIFSDTDLINMSHDSVLQTRITRANCFQLKASLVFNKERKEIQIKPSPTDWVNHIASQLEDGLKNLSCINCLLYLKLGRVHSNSNGSQVFLPDDPYPKQ